MDTLPNLRVTLITEEQPSTIVGNPRDDALPLAECAQRHCGAGGTLYLGNTRSALANAV